MIVNLRHKVALVTGAGQGIGEAIARRFAQAGASVLIATRTAEKGQAVADAIVSTGGTASVLQTDVGRRDEVLGAVAHAVQKYGRLDIVVHNAPAYLFRTLDQLNEEELDRSLAVILKAGFWLIRAALPHLRKQGGGRFLFTSSVTGPNVAMPGTAPYAAAKSGMNGLIRTAALEFARENITVNGVEPGYILTPSIRTLGSEEQIAEMAKSIPLGRFGAPDDVANTMLFLASEEAAYITGQTFVVDGGSTLPESPVVLDAYYNRAGKFARPKTVGP
jgi:3-oxoacyl-[acyl-carrier protein] reductase